MVPNNGLATQSEVASRVARRVIFMATGEAKAKVIAEAFGGLEHSPSHPCERVAPFGARREVLLDRAAASKMPREDGDAEESETS